MFEKHPFGDFVPSGSQFLLLGSFPGKPEEGNDWFYGSKRNQFWPIMETVYETRLETKSQKQKLFEKLNMAITDIIASCKRENESNLDHNLTDIVYNTKGITKIVKENDIEKIFFTSRFVETQFKKEFVVSQEYPDENLIYLPSPSPRYAAMSMEEKVDRYEKLLPTPHRLNLKT